MPSRLSGDEPLPGGQRLVDFWRWMGSDLVSNSYRGILAEYLVGLAVGAKSIKSQDGIREEWDTFDLESDSGIKIEVKSSAYDQTWHQKKPSSISFSIAPTKGWDYENEVRLSERGRWADVYVFCVLEKSVSGRPDPLDIRQWTFYVLPTSKLNESLGSQQTIALNSLKQLDPVMVTFDGIADAVERAAAANVGISKPTLDD